MFLSDFSIKRPVSTVVIIIALMCLGLLALNKLRVNQIPDVEQPVMVVTIPYPGRLARDGRARDHQPRREVAAEHPAGLPDPLDRLREPGADRHHLQLQEEHGRGRRRDPQRDRLGALQAADRDARADPARASIRRRSRSCSWRSRPDRRRTPRSRAWPRTCSPTASARIDGVAVVNVNGSLRRELSVLLRAEKLREYNVSVTEVVNALRAQNTTAPVGRVKGTLDEQSIRLVGRIESPKRVRRHRRQARAATRSCAWARWRPSRTASPSSPASACATRHPNVGLSVTRSRDASTVTVANKIRDDGRRDQQDAARRAPSSRSRRTAARTRRTACSNVIDALMFGAVLTIFVVYAFLNSWRSTLITALSLPTSVIAAFIAVWAVRLHAQLHDAARACRWRSAC